ncbi:MAG: DUF554 domain-containing protein [Treponema sp.]|nr:DUF554 domain-containing protein [Treponema sp.]
MLGPAVNALAIIFFSLIGTFLVRRIPDRFEEIVKKAAGLAVLYLGIRGAFDNENILLLILSLVFGAVIGELINIDKWMNALGMWVEKKLGMESPSANGVSENKRSFSKGFVTASILFCIGSMAIVGSMQSGLQGNHEILFAKSVLDGIMSLVFSASMGIGVAFSALPVFLFEGGIVLASMLISDYLTAEIIREMSAVGSILIAAIGLNFLGIKEIKVANFIPAIFIPLIYFSVMSFM